MIPKLLHIIWVGDEARRPNRAIQTWKDHHPDWTVRVWGNEDLISTPWINQGHISAMARQEWNGVADMMRWEILFRHGGVLVDADSQCIRSLPDWLLECEAFACWENELLRPGLIAAGYFGSIPQTPFLAALIQGILRKPTVTDRNAWESVGPLYLTESWKALSYESLTILPSHFFIPHHFAGMPYAGGGPVYAEQLWGSTLRTYGALADPPIAQPPLALDGRPCAPQAFLFAPRGEDWKPLLQAYGRAFSLGDPVALVLILEPEGPLREDVDRSIEALGADRAEILLLDRPEALLETLRRFPSFSWVKAEVEAKQGWNDPPSIRLSQARLSGSAAGLDGAPPVGRPAGA